MKVIIFGSGQTGLMVASILLELKHEIVGFVDDQPNNANRSNLQSPLLGSREYLLQEGAYDAVCIGIGTIDARLAIAKWLHKHGIPTISAIHPSAVISAEATLGQNLIIGANSTLYINPTIGEGCFIGPSVTVSHDTEVGRFCLLSVGSVIGARCDIEERVFVGSSATIMPTGFGSKARLRVGSGAVIGVGSTVIRDVQSGLTVIGTPAKQIIRK
jgi:sugar O-acyltransferase (sialic acid O-acetyltransferase NeuD family)